MQTFDQVRLFGIEEGPQGERTPLHLPKLVCTVQQGMVLGSLLRNRY